MPITNSVLAFLTVTSMLSVMTITNEVREGERVEKMLNVCGANLEQTTLYANIYFLIVYSPSVARAIRRAVTLLTTVWELE